MTRVSRIVPALLLGVILVVGAGSSSVLATAGRAGAPAAPATTPVTVHLLDGAVVSVSGAVLITQMSDGVQHTYHVAATAPVRRNSQASRLDALQPGDQVTVTTDAGGNVTTLDAVGATAPVGPSATPAAQPSAASPTAAAGLRTLDGTLVAVSNMGLTAQLSDGTLRDLRVASRLSVTRNGRGSSLNALQPGDQITLTVDASGAVTRVDAAGAYAPVGQAQASSGADATQGTVIAVWGAGIAARLPGGVRDYRLASSLRVTRNGQVSQASALRSGDSITVTTDAAGNLTSVDATGRPATTKVTTVADAAVIATPPLVGLLVAAVALLYRRVRGASRPPTH